MDRYRDRRSPDRDRTRFSQPTDSYVPSSSRASRPRSRSTNRYRPRSRTPPRIQADTWRGRPRSRSPARRYEGRTDTYSSKDASARSIRRDYSAEPRREEDGRQSRARSPMPAKRVREATPGRQAAHSTNREHIQSPPRDYLRPRSPPRSYRDLPSISRDGYRPRSRSPPRRNERSEHHESGPYRRRTPSPRPLRAEPRSAEVSGRESAVTSRRSSPRPHLRTYNANEESRAHNAIHPSTRSPLPMSASYTKDEPGHARHTVTARQDGAAFEDRAQPSVERDYVQSREQLTARDGRDPPTGPSYKDSRVPPTGPAGSSRYGLASAASPPTGPAAAQVSMSAHNRTISTVPPAYPRAGSYRGRGGPPIARDYPPRDYPAGASPPRGGRSGYASYGRGAVSHDIVSPHDGFAQESRSGPPGPRNRDFPYAPVPANFRGNGNSTSTTYPRTQRFNMSTAVSTHLSDLPSIKPGGERLPPLHDMSKADKLEEEAARLRKLIDEKQEDKRHALREWETIERQSKTATLRTELAEESLRGLSEEGSGAGVGGVAAF